MANKQSKKTISGGVLAGVYKGNMLYRGTGLLIHSYIEGAEKTLCNRIAVEHLADGNENDKPTCELCLKRDERFGDRLHRCNGNLELFYGKCVYEDKYKNE